MNTHVHTHLRAAARSDHGGATAAPCFVYNAASALPLRQRALTVDCNRPKPLNPRRPYCAPIVSLVLAKSIPKPGTRFALPTLHGSSDAYALALTALELKSQGQMLAVIVANASDAQRLLDEIPWFGGDKLRCHLLPDWETLPYDAFSPHQDLVSERLATLHEISSGQCDVMLVPATTALVRMAPPSFLAAYTFFFKKGESLDEARLKSQLTLAGYTHVTQVMSPGEYSVRGGLIDLFPMGSALPYRLDLFGDTIETIRTFDADTQRSLYPVNEVRLLPGREFPMDEPARTTFRSRWREQFEGDPSRSVVYKDITSGIASAGILSLIHI